MMVVQSGAPFFQPDELAMVCDRLSGFFAGVRPYLAPVPTYAGGMLALVAAGESRDAVRPSVQGPARALRFVARKDPLSHAGGASGGVHPRRLIRVIPPERGSGARRFPEIENLSPAGPT